ncbi:5837_t:CDS:2, partial [Paraglomus occultum]
MSQPLRRSARRTAGSSSSLPIAEPSVTLFCLVHGDPTERAFPVDIEQNKTVGHLRDKIKKKKRPEFDDIAADKLILWAVEISNMFSVPPAKMHIHVIVDRPTDELAREESFMGMDSTEYLLQHFSPMEVHGFPFDINDLLLNNIYHQPYYYDGLLGVPDSVKEYIEKLQHKRVVDVQIMEHPEVQELFNFNEQMDVNINPNSDVDFEELVIYYLLLKTNARHIADRLERRCEFSWDASLYGWILDRPFLHTNLGFDRNKKWDTKIVWKAFKVATIIPTKQKFPMFEHCEALGGAFPIFGSEHKKPNAAVDVPKLGLVSTAMLRHQLALKDILQDVQDSKEDIIPTISLEGIHFSVYLTYPSM